MQLASSGLRVIARKAPTASRSLHVQSGLNPSLGQKLFTQTRLALTRFVVHLTTPGIGVSTGAASATRSFHAANPSIQQRLSFAARTSLARPLHQARFVPRGPVVPRGMTQVGLGTARNFCSGRPVFQQLTDNIPIAGRAIYEADWELNAKKEGRKMRRPSSKAQKAKKASKEMIKPKAVSFTTEPETASELEHYFPTVAVPAVTTHLLIPLAPTPTARAPLPEFPLPASSAGRLPLPALLALHDAHEVHSLRVASLFQRLDTADVWSRGVVCEAYSHGASHVNGEGECTVLKVSFRGWSKAAVRGVIGESGTGWCVLEETRHGTASPALFEDVDSDVDDALSDASSVHEQQRQPVIAMDPAQSFVLPTLDFSSAFLERSGRSPSAHSASSNSDGFFAHPNTSADSILSLSSAPSRPLSPFSEGSGAWSDGTDAVFVDPPSENGWFASQMRAFDDPWGRQRHRYRLADGLQRRLFAAPRPDARAAGERVCVSEQS
ncbi:hypothetical protein MSAN_01644900 [Mycena sanguinolenta]|uniref:Uncharacterized protein n=1 Tax=Mycena sanguinolenta TaxID=230812 RepID=A0A8H7CUK0_9AGAR|nr:hypothetical protein MSAN_01644900 [Mycena sanguinolenta]